MGIVITWLILAAVVWIVASARGRSGFGWFLLSALLISPLLGLILVLCLRNLRIEAVQKKRHEELLQALRDGRARPEIAEFLTNDDRMSNKG